MSELPPALMDQRLRNRIIEVVEVLADGSDALQVFTPSGYFNWFFDFVPDTGEPYPNGSITAEEHEKLRTLATLMNQAADETPAEPTYDDLVSSGWPDRIRPVAADLFATFMRRGKSDEERVEAYP